MLAWNSPGGEPVLRTGTRSSPSETTKSVPSCVGPDNPPRYERVTYGAFTERLLTLNFAHRQTGGSTGE